MTQAIIDQGLTLMLFGMGTVFVFLTLLVLCTSAMSQIIVRFLPEQNAAVPAAKPRVPDLPARDIDPRTLSILQAAIDQHRAPR